jgi:aspartyl-tRNA(Asn)/glutamyl-tRNA(Gln) amidotransferase subunit B
LESLDVSDVRMEEGSLRCDANVSVRERGSAQLGVKVEIKNMNSVRSLERAVRYEAQRQREALEGGDQLVQETRHWNEDAGATSSMRSKEEAFDYRYFPEPDTPPLEPDPMRIEKLRADLPELSAVRRSRYEKELGLKTEAARVLAASRDWAAFFDAAVESGADPIAAANLITQDLAGQLHKARIELAASRITPEHVADLVRLAADGTVSSAGVKQALEAALETGDPIEEIVKNRGLTQVSDEGELGAVVEVVIAENPDPVAKVRAGNDGVLGFLVGQVMQKSGGAANPQLARELLRQRLSP